MGISKNLVFPPPPLLFQGEGRGEVIKRQVFRYAFVTYLLFILFSLQSHAYQLRGVITDENNLPIPYASVYIHQSTYGVSTNLNGEYFLELKSGQYEIVFHSLGYEKRVEIVSIQSKNVELNIQLKLSVTELQEIAIAEDAEDPAYAVIRNAIKAKDQFKNPADEYKCNVYIKSSIEKESKNTIKEIENDSVKSDTTFLTKEKMNFVESYSSLYYKSPNTFKEIKEAFNDFSEKYKSQSGASFSVSLGSDADNTNKVSNEVNTNLFKINISDADFNFYQNLIPIPSLGANPYISPISDLALLSYKYHLEEYFYEDGHWVNKIQVIPRRTDAALFKGYIYIVDGVWCIKSVDLTIDPSALYLYNHFRVIQKYENIKDNAWLLSHESFFYNSKEGKKSILGNTYIKYSNYVLNPDLPNNFFTNELSAILDDAYDKDSVYWIQLRPITLKEEELKFIEKQDSIEEYHKSAAYLHEQDSIVNHHKWDDFLFGLTFQNSFKKQKIFILGLLTSANPLGIGGYRQNVLVMYEKEFTSAYKLQTDIKLNYGFTNQDLKGHAGASFTYLPKYFARIHTSYRNEYGFLNTYESVGATFSMANYINIMGYTLGHEFEVINGLFLDAQLEYLNKQSIENLKLSKWSEWVFGSNNEPVSFDGYEQLIVDITLKFTPFQKYRTEPYKKIIIGSKFPTIVLNYRKGINGFFNSVADFDFIECRIWGDFKIGTFGQSKWKIYTGRFFNNVSVLLTEDKYFRGSDPYFFFDPVTSFQLLGNSLHTSNEYLQAHYLHRFNGVLLNKVPLVKKLHLLEVAGAAALLVNDNNFSHIEAWAGLEKVFKIRRQLFKLGVYYVVADSNYSTIGSQIKFGIDFYDSFRNSWSY